MRLAPRQIVIIIALGAGLVISALLWHSWLAVTPYEGMERISAAEIRAGCTDERLMGHLAGLVYGAGKGGAGKGVDGSALSESALSVWTVLRFENVVHVYGFYRALSPDTHLDIPSSTAAEASYRIMGNETMAAICHRVSEAMTNGGMLQDAPATDEGTPSKDPATGNSTLTPSSRPQKRDLATLSACDRDFNAALPAATEVRKAFVTAHADEIAAGVAHH